MMPTSIATSRYAASRQKASPRVLVVVPTFNERDNLPTLIDTLLKRPDYRVLVVDDGSPDGTGEIADRLVRTSDGRVQCLHRTGPRGLGRAYVDGFVDAIAADVDFICQMDADLSHDVDDVPRMVAAASESDLVIGSRYLRDGRTRGWPLHRRVLSRFANAYARTLAGLTQRDCTSGFRCWRRDALARIQLHLVISRGYAFQVEMLARAVAAELRIVEVPISFRDRARGASKMSADVIRESALMPWRLRSHRGSRVSAQPAA